MKGLLNNQRGAGLIEVLVTLLLISIALLGSASLQVLSKQSNFQAVQRTTAAQLASDYLSRMRSNRGVLANYLPANDLGGGTAGDAPAKNCIGAVVNCTGNEMASFDQWEWEQILDGALELNGAANAGGLIEPTACFAGQNDGGEGMYEVAIAWRGATEHPNPDVHNCGEDTGKYGANNEFRHVLVMQTFIGES